MLTPRQSELLSFIEGQIARSGWSPSFDEMAAAIRVKSKSNISRYIADLEERGFIRRLRYRARAIEVIRTRDMPEVEITSEMVEAGAEIIRADKYDVGAAELARAVYLAMDALRA